VIVPLKPEIGLISRPQTRQMWVQSSMTQTERPYSKIDYYVIQSKPHVDVILTQTNEQ